MLSLLHMLKVLLTRRAQHMRTFPGVWVPPGGGVEAGDAEMIDAAVRELREETGVAVGPEEGQAARIIGLWGSKAHLEVAFPIYLLISNFKARS